MTTSLSTNPQWLSLKQAAEQCLQEKVVAVAGLSAGDDDTAKSIYDKLKSCGYRVYGVNPNQKEVKGIPCFPSLKDLPEVPGSVMAITRPEATKDVVNQALELGVNWFWMHKSFGSSVSVDAVKLGRERGMNIIDGGCPMMFLEPVDGAHSCLRWLLSGVGRIPKKIPVLTLESPA